MGPGHYSMVLLVDNGACGELRGLLAHVRGSDYMERIRSSPKWRCYVSANANL